MKGSFHCLHESPVTYTSAARARWGCAARAEGGKGFGSGKVAQKDRQAKPKKRAGLTNEEAIEKALKLADSKKAAPVDAQKAAEGRIDYARVKDWRARQNEDAGSLEVESFMTGQQEGKDVPFYNELTMAAVNAQQSGQVDDLMYNQFDIPGRKDLPPQESWSYQIRHYMQYLTDLQATHHVLESGIAEALTAHSEDTGVRSAIECFSEARGLDRSLEIAADLNNLESSDPASSVSPAAANYVAYLKNIAQLSLDTANSKHSQEACLKLITHAYCAQLQHLTNGSKLGAQIAEKRNLFAKKAVNMYRRYPHHIIGKDPVVALQNNVNEAGRFLTAEERTVMKWEVPIALAHTNQLFEALGHTE